MNDDSNSITVIMQSVAYCLHRTGQTSWSCGSVPPHFEALGFPFLLSVAYGAAGTITLNRI